ncbi:MAG: hypothetical protein ACF8Q5_02330 [Phycisphaerales bacterium JB040]
MRSFKQISDSPPRGTRWFFIAAIAIATNIDSVTTDLLQRLDPETYFNTILAYSFIAFLAIDVIAVFVIALWAARTYASFLPWLLTIALGLLLSRFLEFAIKYAIHFDTASPPLRFFEMFFAMLPRNMLVFVIATAAVLITYVIRRLPLLPKLVNTDKLSICRKCHYDLAGLEPDARCPECGTPDPGRPILTAHRPRAVAFARSGRVAGIALLALTVLVWIGAIANEEITYSNTMSRYAALSPSRPATVHGFVGLGMNDNSSIDSYSVRGVLVESGDIDSFSLVVGEYHTYSHPANSNSFYYNSSMQHRNGNAIALVEYQSRGFLSRNSRVHAVELPGEHPVLVLTPTQYEHVVTIGIPDSLIEAFADYVREAKPQAGVFYIPSIVPQGDPIDPADHFPPDP